MNDSGLGYPVRLVHFSDIHLTTSPLGWRFRDFCTKRVVGWCNLRWRRAAKFQYGPMIVDALMREAELRPPDATIFSGDATMLGFEAEFAAAARHFDFQRPGLAVPGNHDYYLATDARLGGFERHFSPWQAGERIDGHRYPFALKIGPVWLIGVNSARANFSAFDARGEVGSAQLERLERLLAKLDGGTRILVTHYPIRLADRTPETPWRRLRDVDRLVAVARSGNVCLWLHGHRHSVYCLEPGPDLPLVEIGVGSVTQVGIGNYHEYRVEADRVVVQPRRWSIDHKRFEDGQPRTIYFS